MMKSHLKEMGFTTPPFEAACVQEALKLVQEKKSLIKFIISDWNLPDGTGLEFLKKVRSLREFDKVPFMMVTSENDINHMLEAVTAGSNNYLVKPWNPADLKDKIQEFL